MKLRRQKSKPTARHRQRNDDLIEVPKTFSYNVPRRRPDQNQTETSQGDKRRRSNFWLQRFGLIILLFAVTASAVNVLSLSSTVKILPLATNDSQFLLREIGVYETAANKLLSNSVWNKNKVTVDTSAVSQEMLKQFPELVEVSITVPLLAHRPLVYVQPADPALILVNDNGSFVVSSSGKALALSSNLIKASQPTLPLLSDQSGLLIKLNKQVLPSANVRFIQDIIAQLAAKQFSVSGMILPVSASELDVQLVGQPYQLKFNLQSDTPREQVGTFLATIAELKRQNIVPSKYVDVRVNGRAYYQ